MTREPAMAKTDCTNEKMVWMMLVKISKMEPTRSEKALTIEDMVTAWSIADSGQWNEESCFCEEYETSWAESVQRLGDDEDLRVQALESQHGL